MKSTMTVAETAGHVENAFMVADYQEEGGAAALVDAGTEANNKIDPTTASHMARLLSDVCCCRGHPEAWGKSVVRHVSCSPGQPAGHRCSGQWCCLTKATAGDHASRQATQASHLASHLALYQTAPAGRTRPMHHTTPHNQPPGSLVALVLMACPLCSAACQAALPR